MYLLSWYASWIADAAVADFARQSTILNALTLDSVMTREVNLRSKFRNVLRSHLLTL